MENRLFLDIHAIQTLPPSNVNRDDTGSPKTAQYGGVRRARVSSQAWKKAIRTYFYAHSDQSNGSIRSLNIVQYIADKIRTLDETIDDQKALEIANQALNDVKISTKDYKTKALFFLGEIQARKLAEAAINGVKNKKELQKILKDNPAIDIALFGRMVADDPSLNEDASSQVAHAISTHGVQTEFDFFTAVDDLSPQDNVGAGMLGTVEFNSATMYRYANVAVHELTKQLNSKEAAVNTLKLFVEAFSNSLPTGKVTTFANQTIPQFILVSLRSDRPINLVSAFENPVRAEHGYVEESITKLLQEYKKVQKFVKKPEFSIVLRLDQFEPLEDILEAENMGNLLETLEQTLQNLI